MNFARGFLAFCILAFLGAMSFAVQQLHSMNGRLAADNAAAIKKRIETADRFATTSWRVRSVSADGGVVLAPWNGGRAESLQDARFAVLTVGELLNFKRIYPAECFRPECLLEIKEHSIPAKPR